MRRVFVGFGFDYVRTGMNVFPLVAVPNALARARELFCGGEGWRGLGYEPVTGADLGLSPDTTAPEMADCLRNWFRDTGLQSEDIVVVWFSGHGLVQENPQDLLLQGGGDAPGSGMSVAVLGELLAPIERTLVVADCCHSGLAADSAISGLLKTLVSSASTQTQPQLRDAGREFIAACHAADEAAQLELVSALEHVVKDWRISGTSSLPLAPQRVVAAANDYLVHSNRMVKGKGAQFLLDSSGTSGRIIPVFPNPHVGLPAMPTTIASWIRPKAAGAVDDVDETFRFKGRGTACERVADWLRTEAPTDGESLLLVTGGGGSGKSALLSRVFLLSDPVELDRMRSEEAIDAGVASMLPPEASVNAFVNVRAGHTAEEVAGEILSLLTPDEPTAEAPERKLPKVLQDTAAVTIVVDSVEAANNPDDLVKRLRLWSRYARMIVGCRSDTPAGDALAEGANEIVDLDDEDHYSAQDLIDYVVDILTSESRGVAGTPDPSDHSQRATKLASTIERYADQSFESARLWAAELAARADLPDPDVYRPPVEEPPQSPAGIVLPRDDQRDRPPFGTSAKWISGAIAVLGFASSAALALSGIGSLLVPLGLGALTLAAAAIAWHRLSTAVSSPDRARALRQATDELANAVKRQWVREAAQRGITTPATVRVEWARTQPTVGSARPPSGARPRRMPSRSPSQRLLDHGMLADLHALYQDPDIDKIVIIGDAGAGKSGMLIQLLLECLGSRERARGDRYDEPAPVLMTLGDWNPARVSLVDYASRLLLRDYGAALPGTKASTYRELIEDGRIALFMDGLDEMPEEYWADAIRRIHDVSQLRVVLTSRPDAGEQAHIAFGARITLKAVQVDEASDYIRSACNQALHPERWEVLIDWIKRRPDSIAAEVLSTPLMLNLAMSALDQAGADPCVLADDSRFANPRSMKRFLIADLVRSAYERTDGVSRAITLESATRHLRSLAKHMGDDYDLAWYRIRRWLPGFAPALLCFAFLAAVFEVATILGGVGAGLSMWVPGALVATLVGWFVGSRGQIFVASRDKSGDSGGAHGKGPRLLVSILVGVQFGATLGVVPQLESESLHASALLSVVGAVFGLMGGFAVGVLSLHDGPLVATPQRVTTKDALFGFAAGCATGLTYGLIQQTWRAVPVALVAGIGLMLGVAWTRPPDRPEHGATPLSSYRRDLIGALLLSSVISATATVAFSIELGRNHGLVTAIPASFGLTLPFAALIGASTSQACGLILTTWGLRLKGESVPRMLSIRGASADELALGNAPAGFLEDARRRQLLRSVGTLYQFRHALLQDYLGEVAAKERGSPLTASEPTL